MASFAEEIILPSSHIESHVIVEDHNEGETEPTNDILSSDKALVTDLLSNLSLKEDENQLQETNSPSLLDKYYGVPKPPQKDTKHSDEFDYVVEVYGFSSSLKTKDILNELYKNGSSKAMKLKWVDDTHALVIYTSAIEARAVAETCSFVRIKTRLLSESNHEESLKVAKAVAESIRNFISNLQTKPFTVNNSKLSLKSPPDKVKHKTFTSSPYSGKTPSSAYRTPNDIQYTNNEDLTSTNSTITTTTESSHVHITHYEDGSSQFDIPESSQDREPLHVQRPNTITTSTERPQSSATVARRMISHALGVQIKPSPEQREKETRLLREAKERKQQKKALKMTL